MATCNNCGQNTTKCGCKDSPLTTPTSYTCPPSESCPDPTPCYETIDACCVVHSFDYGLPCLGVTPGMTLCEILQLLNNLFETVGTGALSVSDESVLVEASTTSMNFLGALIEATSGGGNAVDVTVTNPFLVPDTSAPGNTLGLQDTDGQAFLNFGDLATGTLTNWIGNEPSFGGGTPYTDWINDYDDNTYMVGYDPVADIWRPMLAKDIVKNLAYNLYTDDGFFAGNRLVGFNGNNFELTYQAVTDTYTGSASAANGGRFRVICQNDWTGPESLELFSGGGLRAEHTKLYTEGMGTYTGYTDYDTWAAGADPTNPVEIKRIFQGFWNGVFDAGDAFEYSGYKRVPANTVFGMFSNGCLASTANESVEADFLITKYNDEYDVVDQGTRVVTGGGDVIFQRYSPSFQHGGGGDVIGVGGIGFLHGTSTSTHPYAKYLYTGQWNWNKYTNAGTFVDNSPEHFLGNDASGNIVQIQPTAMQNIYNVDGTLTGDRVLDGDGNTHALDFDDLSRFEVQNTTDILFQNFSTCQILGGGSFGPAPQSNIVLTAKSLLAGNGYNITLEINDSAVPSADGINNGIFKIRPWNFATAPRGSILVADPHDVVGTTPGEGAVHYSQYGMPSADGGAGQILKRTAANVVSWSSEISTEEQTETGTGAQTLDFTSGNYVNFTFGAGNATFSFTDPSQAAIVVVKLIQDGVGSRTATFPASVKWVGGSAPTLSTGAGAVDVVQFYFDGTDYNELSRSLNLS